MRYIESDENLALRGAALKEAIEDDIKLGLIPFWVSWWRHSFYIMKPICKGLNIT